MTQKTLSILGVIKKKLDNLDLSHKNKNLHEDLTSEFDYEVPAKKSNVISEISGDPKTENSQQSSASNQQNSQNLDQNNSANSSTNSQNQSQYPNPNQFGFNESGSSKAESSNNNPDKKNNGNFDFNLNFAKDEKNKEVSSSSIDSNSPIQSNSPIEVNKEINNDSTKNPISLDPLVDGSKGNDLLANKQNSFDNNGLEINDKSNIEFENIVEEYEDELSDEDLDGGVSTSSIYNLIVKNSQNAFNYPDEKNPSNSEFNLPQVQSSNEFNLPQVQSSVEFNLSQVQSSNQVSNSTDLNLNFSDDLSFADEKLFGNSQANLSETSSSKTSSSEDLGKISVPNSNEINSQISPKNSSENSSEIVAENHLNNSQIPIDNLIFPNENQPEKNDNMKSEMKLFSRLSSQSNTIQDSNFAISNEQIKLAEKLDKPIFENFKSENVINSSINKNNSLQDNQNSNQEIDLEFEKELMGFNENLAENKGDKNDNLFSQNTPTSQLAKDDISINLNQSLNFNQSTNTSQYQFANDHDDHIKQVFSTDNPVNFDNSIIGKSQVNLAVNNENYQYQSSSTNPSNSNLDSKLSDVKSSILDQQFDYNHDNLDIASEKIFGQKNDLNNDFKNTHSFDEDHHFEDNANKNINEQQLNHFEENNKLDNKITSSTSSQYQSPTQYLQQNQYQSSNSRVLLQDDVIMQSSNSIQKLLDAKSMMTGISNFMKTPYPIEIAVQLMEPKLEKWMNENLAQIVEKIVKEEISKIIPK